MYFISFFDEKRVILHKFVYFCKIFIDFLKKNVYTEEKRGKDGKKDAAFLRFTLHHRSSAPFIPPKHAQRYRKAHLSRARAWRIRALYIRRGRGFLCRRRRGIPLKGGRRDFRSPRRDPQLHPRNGRAPQSLLPSFRRGGRTLYIPPLSLCRR